MPASYTTKGGITVFRTVESIDYTTALDTPLTAIDTYRGAIFASGYEYPGRYSRWDIAFLNPPLQIISRGRQFQIDALNDRGRQLLLMIRGALARNKQIERVDMTGSQIAGTIAPMPTRFREEDRSKQPTLFSVLRSLVQLFGSKTDSHLGLYGAFGYDLVFQFEPIRFRHQRDTETKDVHLFLPRRDHHRRPPET